MKISMNKAEFELDKAGFRFSIDAGVLPDKECAYDKGCFRIVFIKNSSNCAVSSKLFKVRKGSDGMFVTDGNPIIEHVNIFEAIKYATAA